MRGGARQPPCAVTAYLEAANKYTDVPLARVLGHAYAARGYEASGEFDKALGTYQRALAGWDDAFGTRYSTFVRRSSRRSDPFVRATDVGEVTKESLGPRISQLKRSLSTPGGLLVEQGRWLLGKGRYQQAVGVLRRAAAAHTKSPLASEARYLAHRAQLERALSLADVESTEADEPIAMRELEALAGELPDFAVTAAKIGRASILWKRGQGEEAEKLMMEGLTEWHARQRLSQPTSGLEEDVAEIRRAIFLPLGGGVYGTKGWNAFSWPGAPPPFAIVKADVPVKQPDGDILRVTLTQTFPAAENVLFCDTEQIALLQQMMVKLGGSRRRAPRQIMETPNQPVGDSMQILRLWNKFFHARPGHWGGWEVETYPVITEIQFADRERTKASALVIIGYSGATMELEKEGGKWIAKRLVNQWIT